MVKQPFAAIRSLQVTNNRWLNAARSLFVKDIFGLV
jgi:hypothetical protein